MRMCNFQGFSHSLGTSGAFLRLNYVVRKTADERLIDSLSRGKHLVIFGSSKQGKTCLRKHCLKPDDYIVVHCSNKWQIADVNSAILKQAGYEVTQSTSRTTSGQAKVTAKFTMKVFGSGAEVGGEGGGSAEKKITKAPLELDPVDVNDIIRALGEIDFKKYIVLEDFHYLPIETQRDFSVALKAYHEASKLCFIIVGVWLEENRLSVYNGDLTGRVISIDADKWSDEELLQVIKAGEALLNVTFTDTFRDTLVHSCFGSVNLVQESCYKACIESGIFQTMNELKTINDGADARSFIQQAVNEQSGRFTSFLTQFADGLQATTLHMYRWLLYPVITSKAPALEAGLTFKDIRKRLEEKHPQGKGLNAGNVLQALRYTASVQSQKSIKPIILDYDESNLRLRVVDRGFLIWLEMQNRGALLEMLDLPDPWKE
jgi:hypothetical protein